MKRLFFLVLFLLPALRASAQQTHLPPKPLRAEVLITKTVIFIREKVDVDGRPARIQGTGFLVDVPDPRLRLNRAFTYLVTNRHVAEAIDSVNGVCQEYRVVETSFTFNLKSASGGRREHTVTYPNPPGLPWVFPADGSVDLAVLPFGLDPTKYDVDFVALSDFVTPSLIRSRQFGIGDKILFAGLFAPFEGTKEIQPILRQGILSMLPDGLIHTTLCKPGTVYLADVHAIGGNSGSPVFITPRGIAEGMVVPSNGVLGYRLLGVISGYENELENLTLQASTSILLHGAVTGNSGISVIVPAYQLKDLLEGAPLQKLRDETIRALRSKKKKK